MNRNSLAIKALAVAVGVVLVLVLLALAEGVARLVTEPTTLDRILVMLQRDPVLFWRNRADNEAQFFGKPVVTNAAGIRRPSADERSLPDPKPGTLRVLCLGESPTFGWGVAYDEAYPAVLEALLRTEAGRSVDVVNAGMIGFSTHQGRLLLERELLAWRPDVITIPFVINDVDKYRFYRTTGTPDRDLPPESAWQTALRDLLDRSVFLRSLSAAAAVASGQRDQVSGRPVELFRPRESRVPPDDYRRNLEALVALGRSIGARVVFLVMPVNLPVGAPVTEADRQRVRALVEQARGQLDGGAPERALEVLDQALRLDPRDSEAHYFAGVCQRRLGHPDLAARAFDAAMESEGYRCGRDGLAYNAVMADTARALGVPLVDAVAAFDARGREGLFLTAVGDPIHPTREGHALLGRLVYERVRELLPARAER